MTTPPTPPSAEKNERLSLTIPKQKKPRLKNFLLNDLDCERLISIVKDANNASPYKRVSEAAIIKALILLGSKMEIEKVLKAIREA